MAFPRDSSDLVSLLSYSKCCCSAGAVELPNWGPLYSSAALPREAHDQQSAGTLCLCPAGVRAPQSRPAQLPAQSLRAHHWRRTFAIAACHHLASIFVHWCKQDTADLSPLRLWFAPSQALSSCLVNMAWAVLPSPMPLCSDSLKDGVALCL